MANIERLKRLRQRILDHKESFKYAVWVDTLDEGLTSIQTCKTESIIHQHKVDPHFCNTIGCVAGHALFQAIEDDDIACLDKECIDDAAQEYLDLSMIEKRFLFLGRELCGHWNEEGEPLFPEIELGEADVDEAISRIDYLILHGPFPDVFFTT